MTVQLNMSINEGEGFDRVLVPEGNHQAVITRIVDLGTQQKRDFDNPGGTKPVREVKIVFELPALMYTFDEEKGPEPQEISAWYTFNPSGMHVKSNLYKMCRSLVGSELADGFNLFGLLGKNCMINVIHKPGADGKIKDRVDAVSPMMAGMTDMVATGDTIAFYLGQYEEGAQERLREHELKTISASPEFTNYIPF